MSFLDVQSAIYTALNNGLSYPVKDNVPQDYKSFPYVTIGEDVFTPFDTDDTNGHTVSIPVHVWSRKKGRKETKEIQEMIYNLLHKQDISISGFNLVNLRQESANTLLDADGITRHGIQIFNMIAVRN